ncbi:MAG: efflux RND transporter periplasmic adaptor subunit [Chlorobiaceae bacterium]|nr:efflux RND transporter periplasmic adaptor subunit [Chlorobiaceae bacterium]NTW10333.1 efflux RND transporter periplasmic adaptor subunit [Chlorobiaceae bacterium]
MNSVSAESLSKIYLAAFLGLSLLSGGCSPNGGNDAMQKQAQSLPVALVRVADASVEKSYSAMLEGRVNVEVRPQVDGTIQTIYVDEGAKVTAGQPLFKIDDRLYREQYNSALAAQHAAEAKLSSAKLDVDKLVPLVENKVVSEIQLKTAKAAYRADLAAVEQARAIAGAAKVNLDYTLIKAPVGGYIGKIPLRIGSLVTKNQVSWLALLSDVSEVYASFSMSENDFMNFRRQYPGNTIQEKLQKVAPVSLIMSDGSRYPEKGNIGTISGQFDQMTGSVRIRAVFPNPDGLIRSGNTGKVIVESIYHNAVLVPQSATVELQDKVFVFLLDKSNKVHKQVISVAGTSGNDYIVSSGIGAGDTIVTSGIEKLQDGTVVKPLKKSGAPAGAGN